MKENNKNHKLTTNTNQQTHITYGSKPKPRAHFGSEPKRTRETSHSMPNETFDPSRR